MKKMKWFFLVPSLILSVFCGAISAVPNFFAQTPEDGDYCVETSSPNEGSFDDGDKDQIVYEIKSYSDYFRDYEIPTSSAQIGLTTITGEGTASSPYIVNSSTDFIYLSQRVLTNLYIELNCDIILNDESFDENGNPSGGDGKIYQWQAIYYCTGLNLEGNGHSITGLYINNEEVGAVGLFGANRVQSLSNINLENVYINSYANAGAFGVQVNNIRSCNVKSGSIKTVSDGASGFAYRICGNAENCVNYANVHSGKSGAGGLFRIANESVEIENCLNYGDVTAVQQIGAGIICELSINNYIKNCHNYGQVSSASLVGGIVCLLNNSIIDSCINDAPIEAENHQAGGIVCYIKGSATIINCKSSGSVYSAQADNHGMITGALVKAALVENVIIKNCVVDANFKTSGSAFNGVVASQASGKIHLENIQINIGENIEGSINYLSYQVTNLNSTNVKIIDKSSVGGKTCLVFKNKGALSLSNIQTSNINKDFVPVLNNDSELSWEIDGVMVLCLQGKQYYGSDFSKFKMSWKTGAIDLIAFSGRSLFEGVVDESLLIRLGFTKKS